MSDKQQVALRWFARNRRLRPSQVKQWKDQLVEGATGVFGGETQAGPAGLTVNVKTFQAKIGELTPLAFLRRRSAGIF